MLVGGSFELAARRLNSLWGSIIIRGFLGDGEANVDESALAEGAHRAVSMVEACGHKADQESLQ